MTEDKHKLTEIQGDAFNPGLADPAQSEATEGESKQDTARSTAWYTLGTGDMSILRMTLMDQDRETLMKWDAEADRLRSEIRRMLRWMDAGDEETPGTGS